MWLFSTVLVSMITRVTLFSSTIFQKSDVVEDNGPCAVIETWIHCRTHPPWQLLCIWQAACSSCPVTANALKLVLAASVTNFLFASSKPQHRE